jgi:hypothetical protein
MTQLVKNAHLQQAKQMPVNQLQKVEPVLQPTKQPTAMGFNVQTNRVTSRKQTFLKIKDAFKIEVENTGNVDVVIFDGYKLPSYSQKTFETGDTSLGFYADTAINYGAEAIGEIIEIVLTTYTKH